MDRAKDSAFRDELRESLLRLGELAELQPPLDLHTVPAPTADDPYRLVYTRRLARFCGRREELSALCSFAAGDADFTWWSLGGAGGTGKSRLALEAMLALGPTWQAGFLMRDGFNFAWGAWRPLYPTFIAVDYAAQHAAEVARMVEVLAARGRRGLDWPVRLLLIDREVEPAPSVHWSERLLATHAQPTRFRAPMRLGGLLEEDLAAIADDIAGPERAAKAVGLQQSVDPEGRPLFACIAADAVRSATGEPEPADTLEMLRNFLKRNEDQIWTPLRIGDKEKDLTALATMSGTFALADLADAAIAHLALPRPDKEMADRLSAMAGKRPSDRREKPSVVPVQPSLLGEVFVLDRLDGARQLGQDPQRLVQAAWTLDPRAMAGFATRALDDLPTHPAAHLPLKVSALELDSEALEEWCGVLAAHSVALAEKGQIAEAQRWFKHLLRAAKDTRRQSAFWHAARTSDALVNALGPSDVFAAGRVLGELLQAVRQAQFTAVQVAYDTRKPLPQRRQVRFAVAQMLDAFVGPEFERNDWAIPVATALHSFQAVSAAGLPRPLQAPLWRKLAEEAKKLVPETPTGEQQSAGELMMMNAVRMLEASVNRSEIEEGLLKLRYLRPLAAAKHAVEEQEWDTVVRSAVEALDEFEEIENPDEAVDVNGAILRMLVQAVAAGQALCVRPLLARWLNCEDGTLTTEFVDEQFAEVENSELLMVLHTIVGAA